MEPVQYVRILARRWTIIAMLALLGATLAGLIASQTPPAYSAKTTVLFATIRGDSVTELVQGSAYTQDLAQSYTRLVELPVILQPVIDELALPTTSRELARRVSAEAPLQTGLLEVSVVAGDPDEAAAVANAIGRQISSSIPELGPSGPSGGSPIDVTTVSPALPPRFAFAPNTRLNVALGVVLGAALGVAVALVRELTDRRVRTANDVRYVTDLPVLTTVPVTEHLERPLAVTADLPRTEAFRRLRVNLNSALTGSQRSIVVTSARPREGRTSVVVDLAAALAQAGHEVLVIDADFRHRAVAQRLELESTVGLAAVLAGVATLDEAAQAVGPRLSALVADAVTPGSSGAELVGSERMVDLLEEASKRYDVVLVDSPALRIGIEGAVLAQHADGALVVADASDTRRQDLAEALDVLRLAHAQVLGIVLTKVTPRRSLRDRIHSDTTRLGMVRRRPHGGRKPRGVTANQRPTPVQDVPRLEGEVLLPETARQDRSRA